MVTVKIVNAWNPNKCKVFVDGRDPRELYRYVIRENVVRLDMFKPNETGHVYTIDENDPSLQLLTEYYPITSLEIDSGRFGE